MKNEILLTGKEPVRYHHETKRQRICRKAGEEMKIRQEFYRADFAGKTISLGMIKSKLPTNLK